MTTLFEYDVFLPTQDNLGAPYPPAILARVKEQLVQHFGGVTDFRHKSEGQWRLGDIVFRDEIVLLRALGEDNHKHRRFLRGLQRELEARMKQSEILIIEREVQRLDS